MRCRDQPVVPEGGSKPCDTTLSASTLLKWATELVEGALTGGPRAATYLKRERNTLISGIKAQRPLGADRANI